MGMICCVVLFSFTSSSSSSRPLFDSSAMRFTEIFKAKIFKPRFSLLFSREFNSPFSYSIFSGKQSESNLIATFLSGNQYHILFHTQKQTIECNATKLKKFKSFIIFPEIYILS